MKLLNLIPDEEKRRLRIKKIKFYTYIGLLLPIIVFGYMKYTIGEVENGIDEANYNITQVNSLNSSIKSENQEIENVSNTLNNLKQESIPLNFFLLFLGLNIPEDIKIHSILSETLILDRIEKGLTSEGIDSSKENSSETSKVLVVDNSNQENVIEDNTNSNSQNNANSKDTAASNNKDTNTSNNKDTTASNTTDKSTETSNNTVTEKETNIELDLSESNFEVELDNKNIIIRGSALSVKSIGDFIYSLEEADYIDLVETKYIKNYYNGIDNYKLFELKAIVKVGGLDNENN